MSTARTELYLIRHAETVMNTNPHLIGGRSNETPLTEKGVAQAKRLGHYLFQKQLIPHGVYTSPARRTMDTARYSLAEMGLDITPLVQAEIQELGQGPAEGRTKAEVYTEEVMADIIRLGKDFKLPGGESMNDVGRRMHGWIQESFRAANGQDTTRQFVYTHGGAIKYLAAHLLDWPHKKAYETPIDNTSVNLLIGEEGEWRVAYLNRDAAEV